MVKKLNKKMFKKSPEELQEWLKFKHHHSVIESKKLYNRKKQKKLDI